MFYSKIERIFLRKEANVRIFSSSHSVSFYDLQNKKAVRIFSFKYYSPLAKNGIFSVLIQIIVIEGPTLLNNRESTKKICLGLWLVPSESPHFLVSEMLCFKILFFWLFDRINFKVCKKNSLFSLLNNFQSSKLPLKHTYKTRRM